MLPTYFQINYYYIVQLTKVQLTRAYEVYQIVHIWYFTTQILDQKQGTKMHQILIYIVKTIN